MYEKPLTYYKSTFEKKISDDSRIHENRKRINRNLYAISSCQRQMLSIWQTTYSKINFIDVDELFNHSGTFDLADFIVNNTNS